MKEDCYNPPLEKILEFKRRRDCAKCMNSDETITVKFKHAYVEIIVDDRAKRPFFTPADIRDMTPEQKANTHEETHVEHLEKICQCCGYSWYEYPADQSEESTNTGDRITDKVLEGKFNSPPQPFIDNRSKEGKVIK